jgi:signal transduction histidine kinase
MIFSDFIRKNTRTIIKEWEELLVQKPGGLVAPTPESRACCESILMRMAQEMDQERAPSQSSPKALLAQSRAGRGKWMGPISAAQGHGALRQKEGVEIAEVVQEFRMLRVGALSLWTKHVEQEMDRENCVGVIQQVSRFNEAVDQVVAESIEMFSENMSDARELFLASLVHDLRSPLCAISMTNSLLAKPDLAPEKRRMSSALVKRSVKEMEQMVGNILGYTRDKMGSGAKLAPQACDLGRLCREGVERAQASHPEVSFSIAAPEQMAGWGDGPKLAQALGNLLSNASQHGRQGTPIELAAWIGGTEAFIAVKNFGEPIPQESLRSIFDPMSQLPYVACAGESSAEAKGSMGLGLYIVREIVQKHHGSVEVSSGEECTVFSMRLPLKEVEELEKAKGSPSEELVRAAKPGQGRASENEWGGLGGLNRLWGGAGANGAPASHESRESLARKEGSGRRVDGCSSAEQKEMPMDGSKKEDQRQEAARKSCSTL